MHTADILLPVRSSAARIGTVALLIFLVACSGESEPPPSGTDSNTVAGSLRAIMQGMDSAASEIAGGIWTEDYDRIRAGAAAIADHPQIPMSDRQVVQEQLGDDFTTFVRLDQHVHDLAVELRGLANDRAAIDEVLASFQQLQAGCIGCHTPFRPRVATALASRGN
jgi:hypothetical protein